MTSLDEPLSPIAALAAISAVGAARIAPSAHPQHQRRRTGRVGPPQSRELVSSAENLLVLLVELQERGRLRVADAAEVLHVAPPTAHRLLTTLKRHQFAEQDRKRAYLPGPRLTGLPVGSTSPDLVGAAREPIAELAARVAGTALLVTLEGAGGRVLVGAEGGRSPQVRSRVGYLLSAHTTGGVKVLLSHLPDDELGSLFPTARPGCATARSGTSRRCGGSSHWYDARASA